MERKIAFTLAVIFFVNYCLGQGQGVSNNWLMGYYGGYGVTKLNFNSGTPVIDSFPIPMEFKHTHTNISDTLGNILFYTNGYYVADATNDTMQNGSGINPSTYTNYFSDGLGIPQANIILPLPNSNHLYYLIHSTADKYPGYTCSYNLYLSIIDMNQNGGLGAITVKNQVLITDSMNPGKISACKHANGRDWWIFCHRMNSNKFYSLLLTPYGIFGPYSQNIGVIRNYDGGQAVFSQDGTRYAYYHIYGGLEVFDFDRCSGNLSNPQFVSISNSLGGINVGMAISSNSNVLYVPNVNNVLQYDLTSTNISLTEQVVAVYDSFTSYLGGAPPLQTLFGLAALAPDGKIYISTGNSTIHMHVINQPNSLGTSCNLVQHGLQLPTYDFNSFPNHPNYFLGKIPGSPCDTVLTSNGVEVHPEIVPKIFPNPTTGKFNIWFTVHNKPGVLEIFDVNGKLVRKEFIAEWSQYKQVDISTMPAGIYMSRLSWNERITMVKIVKQ
jgi:hypothetical protein